MVRMLIQDPFDYAEVFAEFELPLDPERVASLYPFAPVFLVEAEAGDVVLKRTRKPFERALALADWERELASRGVAVVEPVPEIPENPREVGEDVWVVYPYVEGQPYEAAWSQLRDAGALLGRMHAVLEPAPGLVAMDWEAPAPEDLEEDMEALAALPFRHEAPWAEAIAATVADWLDDHPDCLARLSEAGLPEADCSWDYKANNLVFTEAGAVLIDPDLAGRLPRLLDLALACLLFHNEIGGGGGRMLTPAEWAAFLDGYYDHVELTEAEIDAWPDALRYMFVDEALWLVFNEYEIDAPVQQRFMDDLLAFVLAPDRYALA